jgi:hypothetical protein
MAETREFHLVPDADKKDWALKEKGKNRAVRRFASKGEGQKYARDYAKKKSPSVLVMHKADGTVQGQTNY